MFNIQSPRLHLKIVVHVGMVTLADVQKVVDELTKEVMSLKGAVGSLIDFVAKDAEGIESEINRAVVPHIKAMNPGYTLKKFSLQNVIIKHSDGTRTQLTQFDGAFILTNMDATEKSMYTQDATDPERNKLRREASLLLSRSTTKDDMTINNAAPHTHLVIVEAKHNVTRQRINNKYKTMWQIRLLLDKAKYNGDSDPEIKTITRNFKLDTIEDVKLFMGGPVWEEGAITYLKALASGKRQTLDVRDDDAPLDMSPEEMVEIVAYMAHKVGYASPNGSRYSVSDENNSYNDDIPLVVPISGGGRRQRGMTILKQYVTVLPG